VYVCVILRASNEVMGKAGTAAGLVTARYQAGEEGDGNIRDTSADSCLVGPVRLNTNFTIH
jgi:hypothetical protein